MLLLLRLFRTNGTMKYYKDIAAFLKISIPIVNEEISLPDEQRCSVLGIRQEIINDEPKFTYDRHEKHYLPFSYALEVAKELSMDLCLLSPKVLPEGELLDPPVLNVALIREQIYREYFLNHLKRKKDPSYYKTLRLGERIEKGDLKHKVNNIERMVEDGHRTFKLVSANDSELSQKVLVEFGKHFKMELEPEIYTYKKGNLKPIERWAAIMHFNEEVPIDVYFINRKWKRKLLLYKLSEIRPAAKEWNIEDYPPYLQQYIIQGFEGAGIDIADISQSFKKRKEMLNKFVDREAMVRYTIREVGETIYNYKNGIFVQRDYYEERLYMIYMSKYAKTLSGRRTANDIVEEMYKLKRDNYDTYAYKIKLYKDLYKYLQALLRMYRRNSK